MIFETFGSALCDCLEVWDHKAENSLQLYRNCDVNDLLLSQEQYNKLLKKQSPSFSGCSVQDDLRLTCAKATTVYGRPM